MRRICAVALVALLAVACDPIPRHKLTLTFNDAGDRVTIEAETTLPALKDAKDRTRVEQLRDALIAGNDEWSLRFQHAAGEHERVIYERTRGDLNSVQRITTIDADDLQKFFYDLPITAKVTRGDGWAELAIYPGTSTRASRQDHEDFDKKMAKGAAAARRYINAVRVLYEYLDEHEQRAVYVFLEVYRDDDDPNPPEVTKLEADLAKEVRESIDHILEIDWSGDLMREADLVSNPFPAEVVVHVAGEPLIVEGFTREQHDLVIKPKTLLEAIASLEGRWISPDPLAYALHAPGGLTGPGPAGTISLLKRRAAPVVGFDEVLAGLREQLKPADRYRVRFITKAAAP
ncbi:MAG TPA: hypothetical protein VJZ76_13020 [Thermoanaerobaculia bacterium]|nr:hypothetical protein [Thermoanaerobaculia bacterium]